MLYSRPMSPVVADDDRCRCGAVIVQQGRGRRRKWCSDACRADAARDRAARQLVESGDWAPQPTPAEAVDLVLSSPTATRDLLVELTALIDADRLSGRIHNATVDAIVDAHNAVVRAQLRANPMF